MPRNRLVRGRIRKKFGWCWLVLISRSPNVLSMPYLECSWTCFGCSHVSLVMMGSCHRVSCRLWSDVMRELRFHFVSRALSLSFSLSKLNHTGKMAAPLVCVLGNNPLYTIRQWGNVGQGTVCFHWRSLGLSDFSQHISTGEGIFNWIFQGLSLGPLCSEL